jgi:hypothetical protein
MEEPRPVAASLRETQTAAVLKESGCPIFARSVRKGWIPLLYPAWDPLLCALKFEVAICDLKAKGVHLQMNASAGTRRKLKARSPKLVVRYRP